MALVIEVVARESSNAIRDALTTPPTDAKIVESFAFAERGSFANPDTHARTAINGGWIGGISITRNPDGTAEAHRTWALNDEQQAATGLTNTTATQAFAQALADDVHAKLIEWASRNALGQLGDFWSVVATPHAPVPAPSPAPPSPSSPNPSPSPTTGAPWSTGTKVVATLAVAGVIGGLIYVSRK